MTARPRPRLKAILVGFSRVASGVVIVIAAIVLAGWTLSSEWMKSLSPAAQVSMNPMTAACLIFLAVAVQLLIKNPAPATAQRRLAIGFATIAALVGILKLLSYRFSVPVDRLLFPVRSAANPIAPNTAMCLVAVGAALALLEFRTRRGRRPAVVLALLTTVTALLALTGYLFGVMWFQRMSAYIPMALSTAIAFLLLAVSILAARPEFEPMATILSDTAGGVVARRLLPAAAILPLGVGWVCLFGSHLGLYEKPFGLTLYSLLTTIIFVTLTWGNARFLLRLDVERHRAQGDAAEEHHLLRSLIDNLPDMVFVKDTQSRFLLNNLAHARGLGAKTPEEMQGKSDRDYFDPVMADQFRTDEARVIATGIPIIDQQQTFTDKTGRLRCLTVTKVPFYNTRREVVGTVGITHDITQRKEAESERDQFFTLSADMMCVAGFDGYFKRVNPAFETTLGYPLEEMSSRPWLDFVHPDDRAATEAEGKKLALGAVTLYFENRYRCKDGSYRWLSWTVVPIVREQRLFAVARDTTERRLVEERLRQTNRKLEEAVESERQAQQILRTAQTTLVQTEKLAGLGQMVAGVAHEINNPLSFVSNNVAVLQREIKGILKLMELYGHADAPLREHDPKLAGEIEALCRDMDLAYVLTNLPELLTRSREGLRRIQQIVKDLRDFARLDESDLHEVNLNDGIGSTITIVQGHAKKRGIELKTDLGVLPAVTCYPAKINQVIMNLVTNAIDASNDGGEVIIRTRPNDANTIRVEVADTGSGIDPAIRQRIFDPFFTTKPQGEGTGLGLSISYGIIRDHGGTIEVQSEPGKGSTFAIILPVHGPGRTGTQRGQLTPRSHQSL